MCKNEQVSLTSFLVAGIIGLYLITVDQNSIKALGYFLLTFILIQLLEFFIWNERKHQGLSHDASDALIYAKTGDPCDKNAPSSEFLTSLIVIALWLQPLVQTYMAYKYGRDTIFTPLIVIFLTIYAIIFIYSILRAFGGGVVFSAQPYTGIGKTGMDEDGTSAGGHLHWMASDGGILGGGPLTHLYLFGLFFGLLFTVPAYYGWIVIVYGLAVLTYALTQHARQEVGSMWCLYAVGLAFILLIMSFIPVKNASKKYHSV